MWRQVSIAPGAKSDFVFQVTEAEGEKNVRGGYQKKAGAEVKRITVGVSSRKLLEYASKIEAYYQDYLANLNGMRGIGRRTHRFLLRQLLLRFRLRFLLL